MNDIEKQNGRQTLYLWNILSPVCSLCQKKLLNALYSSSQLKDCIELSVLVFANSLCSTLFLLFFAIIILLLFV